jgi:hypothetical protein
MLKYIILLVFSINLLWAQDFSPLGKKNVFQIQESIQYLASEELAGRAPGTKGHQLAQNYIVSYFKRLQLHGVFEGSFLQELQVPNKVAVDTSETVLFVKNESRVLGLDFYPVKFSSNGFVSGKTRFVDYGIESPELERDDIDDEKINGAIAVMEIGSPDGVHPHSAYKAYHDLYGRLKNLAEKGAAGVVLVDVESKVSNPASQYKTLSSCGIPVIFVENEDIAKRLVKRKTKVAFKVSQKALTHTVANIAGFINNDKKHTVIIGAHYDHLGRSKENSRFTGDANPIHFGADDNASGTAALLEITRYLKNSNSKALNKYNYLMVAFTAEEMGLLGSKHLADNLPQELKYAFMLNMDMIGRLRDNSLQINGVGTSPAWKKILDQTSGELDLVLSASGVGPSDHTSFYYKDIPVLHFFTGTHPDYHKPSDIAEKINSQGILQVANLILQVLAISQPEKVEFTPTKNESTKAPRFSVTLGVMPNYMYTQGLKLDGVTAGKPAAKAGLQTGDVITQMGNYSISDIQSYMTALAAFKEGMEIELTYLRKGQQKTTTVKF